MSVLIPVEGKFLALTVVGKNSENTKLPFPSDAVFTWAIDNPVIATISEITPGDGTIRKIPPKLMVDRVLLRLLVRSLSRILLIMIVLSL